SPQGLGLEAQDVIQGHGEGDGRRRSRHRESRGHAFRPARVVRSMSYAYSLSGKRVWVAGHRGMVGSALVRRLASENCEVLTVARSGLDLTRQVEVETWMRAERPQAIFLAAAVVGGIIANSTRPVEFLTNNLQIQNNIIATASDIGVEKLMFL